MLTQLNWLRSLHIVKGEGPFSSAGSRTSVLLIMICTFNRYTDAISKYESVMKMEPNIAEYTIRSKERICHCFSKVTVDLFPDIEIFNMWVNNPKFFSDICF